MGIYLGQLPPAEIARLKAELAETLIANFCYPRFFDNRTASLRMRPVDRAKRQEVWLYLSSVDFTSWSRVDLMSPDFQHQIERLFIQFVQRNRSFFGEQGRRRMPDVRMLINTSASGVVQGLRNHLTGQRQNNPPFGSPRPVISWSSIGPSRKAEATWEQIASMTMLLQQQLQELRGEIKPSQLAEPRSASSNGAPRRSGSLQATPGIASERDSRIAAQQPPIHAQQTVAHVVQPAQAVPQPVGKGVMPASSIAAATTAPMAPSRKAEPSNIVADPPAPIAPPPTIKSTISTSPHKASSPLAPPAEAAQPAVSPPPIQTRGLAQAAPPPNGVAASQRETTTAITVGEDDMAIFEQMRHQLILWLRVEAIKAGLEISGQAPAQLLDLLRQQARLDETRLQVVSTLLNLSNQVIKTGTVSILDYKQALMFHLMHTRG